MINAEVHNEKIKGKKTIRPIIRMVAGSYHLSKQVNIIATKYGPGAVIKS